MPGPINNNKPSMTQFLQQNEGKTLEVINVSANPEAALTSDADVMEIHVDHNLNLQEQLPDLQKGDYLRVRARSSNGNVSNWINLQASELPGEDTRNAQMFVDAMAMEVNSKGGIDALYLGDGMVSEPGAKIQFLNERTGEKFLFTVDENGQLPEDLGLKGKAGDQFLVSVSDGVHNTDFSEVAGKVTVEGPPDIKDPAVWAKRHLDSHGNPTVKLERFNGPLFIDGVSIEDVRQGAIADCYFPAAMTAIANTQPEKIKQMFKENDDGTVTVTFQQKNRWGQYVPKRVRVDRDLYVKYSGGRPLYGGPMVARNHDSTELWFALAEKAYAALHGNSYDNIGNGGIAGDVISAVTGRPTKYTKLNKYNLDRVFRELKRAQEKNLPATAGTYGEDVEEAERYAGQRIYAWHNYTILGVEEKNGEKYVKLRNPWGSSEPGYDGKNDGIFSLPLEKFGYFFESVTIAQ